MKRNGLKDIINVIQMPLYFSLSGYLFAFTHSKKRGMIALLKNKALRLLVPYVGIGVCFLLPVRMVLGFPSYKGMGPVDFALKLLMSNDVGHLWFLPALFCIFVLSEFFLTALEKIPGIRKYPAIFFCVVSLAIYLEGYRFGFGYPPLLSAINYLIWFSFGYFLNTHQALLALNVGMLTWCVTADAMRVLLSLGIVALCIMNIYGAIPEKSCSMIQKIDRNSFGVYLFHSPLIYITFANIPNAHPAIVVFVNLVVFGAATFGLTELVRRIKLKVLIGE